MTTVRATKQITKHSGDNQTYAFDLTDALYSRTISSVTVSADTGITIAGETPNSSTYTDDDTGATVAANSAIEFNCSGGTDGVKYKVEFTATLSDSKTLVAVCYVHVKDG